jgi:hypothetical protein
VNLNKDKFIPKINDTKKVNRMDCFYHKTKSDFKSCERCNRPICNECNINFKNAKITKEITLDEDESTYIDEKSGDLIEELNWCIPCYYNHFVSTLPLNNTTIRLFLSAITDLIVYSTIVFILLISLIQFWKMPVEFESFQTTTIDIIFILLLLFIVILLYYNKRKKLEMKFTALREINEIFLMKTNFETILLPIECFYCKETIDSESFACMNVNCTLGEELSNDTVEIPLEPVKSNYGLFVGLKKLPQMPSDDVQEENDK